MRMNATQNVNPNFKMTLAFKPADIENLSQNGKNIAAKLSAEVAKQTPNNPKTLALKHAMEVAGKFIANIVDSKNPTKATQVVLNSLEDTQHQAKRVVNYHA